MYVHIAPPTFTPREDFRPRTVHTSARPERRAAKRTALPINAYVADDALMVEALLPGVSPEDVQVTVEQGVLTLAATRRGTTPSGAPDGQAWYAYEFAPGAFSRALRLPFPVAVDEVTAAFAHGLLTITAPKAAAAKVQTIAIGGQPREPRPARATS